MKARLRSGTSLRLELGLLKSFVALACIFRAIVAVTVVAIAHVIMAVIAQGLSDMALKNRGDLTVKSLSPLMGLVVPVASLQYE